MPLNPLKPYDQPGNITEYNNDRNPCCASDSTVTAVRVVTKDGTSHLLPYAQFLRARRDANPELEQHPDGPPERLLIQFVQAEVLVLGCGLRFLEDGLRKSSLSHVQVSELWRNELFRTLIGEITVRFQQEAA
jgi:hypothetical protein